MPPVHDAVRNWRSLRETLRRVLIRQDGRGIQEDFQWHSQCPRDSSKRASLGLAGIASLDLVERGPRDLGTIGQFIGSPTLGVAEVANSFRQVHGSPRFRTDSFGCLMELYEIPARRPPNHQFFFRMLRA